MEDKIINEENEEDSYETFKTIHEQQLKSSCVPQHFWKSLCFKLRNSIFDAGDAFSIFKVEPNEEEQNNVEHSWKVLVIKEDGIDPNNPKNIYLIDHAWTYRVNMARDNLRKIPYLLERMASLMEISNNERSQESVIEDVFNKMWKFNQTYHLGNPGMEVEDKLPIWYIMDEFGSRIQHSDDPAFRTVPFFYSSAQITYTLLFPIKELQYQDEVTRNYIEGPVKNDLVKKALKIPWFPCRMTEINFEQKEHDQMFLKTSVEIQETIPTDTSNFQPPKTRPLKVFSEYEPLNRSLTHPQFQLVNDESEADVLWYTYHFKDYKHLNETSPHKQINQFPYENRITVKDLLCVISRLSTDETYNPKTLETYPLWLPTTFNLETELPMFVSYYQQREERNLDNTWICKPWNLARSLDIHITKNLDYILRLPATGPKIVSKYIENPVLFYRNDVNRKVKFDIRYIILLRKVKPLTVYIYRRFWLRFANKEFSMDSFDDYEKHFTVMNYNEADLLQMYCHDFIEKFELQNPGVKYSDIEKKIFLMIKNVFEGAARHPPPNGICQNLQSRAMYAVDLMLQWFKNDKGVEEIRPMILEMNWMPDCKRACDYYPEFFNDVFSVLFLDDAQLQNIYLL